MKRQHQPPYVETNMSPYNQHRGRGGGGGGGGGNTYYPGRSDSLYSEAVEDELPPHHHQYKSAAAPPKSAEGQWSQWDREPQNLPPPNQVPSHAAAAFNEGQGGNVAKSYYQTQTPDPKVGLESQGNKEARPPPLEQDMEIGYEDNTVPLTFEGLERKFYDDVMKLAKEQTDAEDAENARHRERITEINTRYQEKLSAVRAQQANRREEFLRKEGQARLSQYQQAGMSQYSNTSLQDARGYSGTPVSGATGEAHRAYASNQNESYRDRPNYSGSGRSQSAEGRVPYPEGRVYNNAGARYF